VTLEGVVFDFDGVIANSEPVHLRVYQILLSEEGLSFPASEYYEHYLGLDDLGILNALARDKGLDIGGDRMHQLIARKTQTFLRLVQDRDVLFPGAAACLRAVAAAVPVAIASGALLHEIVEILEGAGVRPLVPVIVAAGDTPRGKPAPDPFARAVELLSQRAGQRLKPSCMVALEDSRPGLRAARDAGLRTLGVSTSYPAEVLHEADHVVPDISHVTVELLDSLTASSPARRISGT
jgi:beta-phosphoglucomutase